MGLFSHKIKSKAVSRLFSFLFIWSFGINHLQSQNTSSISPPPNAFGKFVKNISSNSFLFTTQTYLEELYLLAFSDMGLRHFLTIIETDGDGYPDIEVDGLGIMLDENNNAIPDCLEIRISSTIVDSTKSYLHTQSCNLPSIHFDEGSAQLKPEYYPELYYIAQVMKNDPKLKVKVTGYANIDSLGRENRELPLERAESAVNFLCQTYGIENIRFIFNIEGPLIDPRKDLDDDENHLPNSILPVNRKVDFDCVRE
ncbi:MAG: OmpA family protein [Bacteroidia bacterium]|nr:OmpA family protein [Bacteroidia bacterium]